MKVYFSGALFTQGDFSSKYKGIVRFLKEEGFEVMEDTTQTPYSKFQKMAGDEIENNYKKALKWIDRCDFAVFEASFPSTLSIGHEIDLALGKGKPVIVMYLKDRSPRFFMGYKNDMVVWVEYEDDKNGSSVDQVLKNALDAVKNKVNVRFNLFFPRSLMAYLDWATKNKGMNKSEYIRKLIEKEVETK